MQVLITQNVNDDKNRQYMYIMLLTILVPVTMFHLDSVYHALSLHTLLQCLICWLLYIY